MIRKVLIANRGEIAVRIMRTAKARGMATVAVYSDADAGALHMRCADEALRIGPAAAAQSYLSIEKIIEAAKRCSADAIHPGYGFLSERAAFAEACEKDGIIFIGPPASAIAAMGDKAAAKERMIAAGVPCVPGYQGEDQAERRLKDESARIGYPVMLKAAAGGGGRGMRLVESETDLAEATLSARREAQSAFGDGRLIVEKAVRGARHIEIQVIADAHGNIVHLGERDCSMQRRRQKVIEEAPSPAITPELRKRMGEAAVEAARAVGYVNAGTVEFLFDPKTEEFFFLEMNTRLQVEHPVTEMITGLDLVALQFDVAEGKPLPFVQEAVRYDGWAIEARLYAEDPAQGFLPQSGKAAVWRHSADPHPKFAAQISTSPQGGGGDSRHAPPIDLECSERDRRPPPPWGEAENRPSRFSGGGLDGSPIRVDSGIEQGDAISTFYDPLVAKIIAHGATRDEARLKLIAALKESVLLGVPNNCDFLIGLLEDNGFTNAAAATDYIEKNLDRLVQKRPPSASTIAVVAAVLLDDSHGLLTGWNSRGASAFPLHLATPSGDIIKTRARMDGKRLSCALGADEAGIEVIERGANELRYVSDGQAKTAYFARHHLTIDLDDGRAARYLDFTLAPATEGGAGADAVLAPMAGAVTSVAVKPGDAVIKGQTVATIEAMKMEHHLKAPRDGVVAEMHAKPGDQVSIRAKIVSLARERAA